MSKIGDFFKNINRFGADSDKLKFLNFIAVSDNDATYVKENWRKTAKKLRTLYIFIILFVTIVPFFPLLLPVDEQNKWTSSALFSGINVFILVVLLCDYAFRWITYPFRASKYSSYPLFFFPLSGISLLMIFSMLPTLVSVFAGLIPQDNPFVEFIRIFSIMRIIRLVMLLNVVSTFKIFSQIFERNRVLLINVFIFVFIMAVIFALLIYSVEGGTQLIDIDGWDGSDLSVVIDGKDVVINKSNFADLVPKDWLNEQGELIKYAIPINDKIRSIWDGLYFTLVTITTIGYGDISPVTTMGRIVVIIDAVLGIVVFSIPSGIITGSFIVEAQEMYRNRKLTNKEKEMNKMSFAEKIYYNTSLKTKNLVNTVTNNKDAKSVNTKARAVITIEGIKKDSEIFKKIINYIDDDNIESIRLSKNKENTKIIVRDIRDVADEFYGLCNLLELTVKTEDNVSTKILDL